MFEVCLFDLDQTLVDTDDMTELREAGKNKTETTYIESVKRAFGNDGRRLIYPEALLLRIRKAFPALKLGVFTRSPRSYARTVLQAAYPKMKWDVIVAYEDVKHTKPYGEGIDKAMWSFGYKSIPKVVLVGDGDNDIRAAYNAGCVVILDRTSWNRTRTSDNWRALAHMPDAIIDHPDDLVAVLTNYESFLPELERVMAGAPRNPAGARFDRVNKFIPKAAGGDNTAFPVFACGRSFAGYKSLEWRAKWHDLTESIHAQKSATEFPQDWVDAVRSFISTNYAIRFFRSELLITVVPHRPGRTPRLEAFLAQIEASLAAHPLPGRFTYSFCPDLLSFKPGVRSNSNDKLGAMERFENIRDHLVVKRKNVAKGAKVLVIDDVSTTGSSLIYAKKYLEAEGASEITSLSIAMNISNVLYD